MTRADQQATGHCPNAYEPVRHCWWAVGVCQSAQLSSLKNVFDTFYSIHGWPLPRYRVVWPASALVWCAVLWVLQTWCCRLSCGPHHRVHNCCHGVDEVESSAGECSKDRGSLLHISASSAPVAESSTGWLSEWIVCHHSVRRYNQCDAAALQPELDAVARTHQLDCSGLPLSARFGIWQRSYGVFQTSTLVRDCDRQQPRCWSYGGPDMQLSATDLSRSLVRWLGTATICSSLYLSSTSYWKPVCSSKPIAMPICNRQLRIFYYLSRDLEVFYLSHNNKTCLNIVITDVS
jgi:hypothetical protein